MDTLLVHVPLGLYPMIQANPPKGLPKIAGAQPLPSWGPGVAPMKSCQDLRVSPSSIHLKENGARAFQKSPNSNSRSSGRVVRTRVPFFSIAYFSSGTLPQKRVGTTGGPRIFRERGWVFLCSDLPSPVRPKQWDIPKSRSALTWSPRSRVP